MQGKKEDIDTLQTIFISMGVGFASLMISFIVAYSIFEAK